jgi:hypothetical protein
MVVQRGDLECCVHCSGPAFAERLARRAALRAALHAPAPAPGLAALDEPVPLRRAAGRPGPAHPAEAPPGPPGPLPVLFGTVIDASPQTLIVYTADGEQRLVLAPGTAVWRGHAVEPTALEPGDSVLVRMLPGEKPSAADRVWANLGRVTGVIVNRDAEGLLVQQSRMAALQAVRVPARAAARLQVRFPRLEPGYLIDVIGLRHAGYLEAALPATSQPAYRADDPAAPATAGRGPVPRRISGSATWHELSRPDTPPGIWYPALDPGGACQELRAAGPPRPRLPYLSIGSLVGLRSDCTGRAQVLPVSGCAPSSRLFDDRCVTCGTSPRGRVAVLPMGTFAALGGELERGCFNATISVGLTPTGEPR